ncbi:MAG TPA: hypothetical protein VK348_08730, partial [Planctomycetota bacterium]|nr:hypothetical protein [Planctomycetota bacterium]
MRTALMVSLLTTIAAAQQPATEQLHDHLDGKLELSWLRLGERLVTATMDEDSSAVADALLAAMAATAPAERRSRAFATLDRWNELPCASDLPVAKQLLLQQALLPAITDPTLQPPARSTALLALGGLSPRLRNVWLGPAEARLRAALQHRSEQATDELLPACLRYLARVAPDSAFTLPAVIAVTLAADTSEPVLQAGLAAILAIGSRGSVADARAACSACAALLRDCSPERAEAVLTGMRQLLRA